MLTWGATRPDVFAFVYSANQRSSSPITAAARTIGFS